jgi:hypothetical protein
MMALARCLTVPIGEHCKNKTRNDLWRHHFLPGQRPAVRVTSTNSLPRAGKTQCYQNSKIPSIGFGGLLYLNGSPAGLVDLDGR